jgi:hypothetical protein
MTNSLEVISYLNKNLKKRNIVSLFIAGSVPNVLLPKSDLDIFIVIKAQRKNYFFENLANIMNPFVKNNKGIKYSLFRGPLKYNNLGLIHFIVYTEEKNSNDYEDRVQFRNESRPVLKSFLKKSKIIYGKTIKQMTQEINWKDTNKFNEDILRLKDKYIILKNKNWIKYREWKNLNGNWEFIPTKKYPGKFLKKYLIHYFKNNLSRK